MSPRFKDRLLSSVQAARSETERVENDWQKARKLIMSVMSDAKEILPALELSGSNNKSCNLRYGDFVLSFHFDRSTGKIFRTYPGVEREYYDLDNIDVTVIENEIAEFVRYAESKQ